MRHEIKSYLSVKKTVYCQKYDIFVRLCRMSDCRYHPCWNDRPFKNEVLN